ncbi:MFS transporter [Kitasatospora camelliae]|uniref:MFS transporter n=1 Tax=Kitasatospora camelliae TaxID=3156397 RepID=A0AAU8K0A0_9ACTN
MSPTAATAPTDPTAPTPGAVRRALATLALAVLLPSLGTGIANVALPALAHSFGASFQAVQWVVIAYLLAVTALIVTAGRLGDLVGRRRLLLGGIALFTAASLLCGLASQLWMLIAARAAQGLGAAAMMALTMAFVGDTVPKERTGRAMGLLGTMSAVGTALGPSLGGLLVSGPGWRAVFLVTVPLGVLTLLLARRHLPPDRPRARTEVRFDHPGTVLLALTLGAYALAMTLGHGRPGVLNLALLLAAALGAGLFLRTENRTPAPLVRPAMFRDRALSASLVAGALVSTVMMSTLVVGPFHLSRALGLSAAATGLVMSAGPLVAALTGVPAGRAVDRLGPRRTTLAGLAAVTTGCLLLAVLPARYGVPGYLAPLLLTTCGYALFQTANNTAVMADLPADRRGVVSGLLNLSRNLGLVTGASLMGTVFALGTRTADLTTATPAALAHGTRTTFAVAAALVVAAGLVQLGARAGRLGGAAGAARPAAPPLDSTPAQKCSNSSPNPRS